MAAGTHNIIVEQGADFELNMTIKDSAGDAIDLTDHVFRGQIRKKASSSEIVASFSFVIDSPETGIVLAKISNTATAAMETGVQKDHVKTSSFYVYDIESEISGVVTRWIEGTAELTPEVTKDAS